MRLHIGNAIANGIRVDAQRRTGPNLGETGQLGVLAEMTVNSVTSGRQPIRSGSRPESPRDTNRWVEPRENAPAEYRVPYQLGEKIGPSSGSRTWPPWV